MAPARSFDDVPSDLPAATHPVALLPIHLETRFVRDPDDPALLVRVYPDDLHIDTHEPALTDAEHRWGRRFWEETWRAGPTAGEAAAPRREDAWARLAERFGAPRAAWIARTLTPTNPDDLPEGPVPDGEPLPVDPVFAPVDTRDTAWTRAPRARLLPERWVVVAHRDGERVLLDWSTSVTADLPVGPDPGVPPPDPTDADDSGDDGPVLDPHLRWIVDFEEAAQVGMAVRIPITAEDLERGFDTVAVFGVRASADPGKSADELAALLDAHHHTDGLALVAPGTPTNNTTSGPAGHRSGDTSTEQSYAIERGEPLFRSGDGADGDAAVTALGLAPATLAHVAGADRTDQVDARHLRTALWPATWGYYLDHLVGGIGDEATAHARRHFVDHVRPAGPLPTLRLGTQPYGLLPVLPLDGWAPNGDDERDDHLVTLLRAVRPWWREAVASVPRVGPGSSARSRLLQVLGMEAVSSSYAARPVLDREHVAHLVAGDDPRGIAEAIAHGLRVDPDVVRTLGLDGEPRLAALALARHAVPISAPPAPTAADLGDVTTWLRDATYEDLRSATGPETNPSLLTLLLRHAMMVAYAETAWRILHREELTTDDPRPEPAFVDATVGSTDTPTLGRSLDRRVDGLGDGPLGSELAPGGAAADRPEAAELRSVRDSLAHLATRPPADLARGLAATLDACSHRFDAWATSLATKRLHALRTAHPAGVHLGAYGWVRDLRPVPEPTRVDPPAGEEGAPLVVSETNAGHVHAPSLDHAAAAAILRSGHLAHPGRSGDEEDATAPFAVDLSSARVRQAHTLLDGLRGGLPLAALLGYRFERGLHERHLEELIEPFRRLAPLGELYETLRAMNILEGLVATWQELVAGAEEDLEEARQRRREAREELEALPTQQELRDRARERDDEADRVEEEELPPARQARTMAAQKLDNAIRKGLDPGIIERLRQDLVRAEQHVEELELRVGALRSVARDLREEAEDLPERKQDAEDRLAFWQDEVREARRTLGRHRGELRETQAQLRAAEQRYDRLQQERRDRFLYPPTADIEAMESLVTRDVVDGLELLRRHERNAIPWGLTLEGRLDLPARDDDRAQEVIAELELLQAGVDAVNDACVAEAVYQAVRGNPERIAGALDTVTRGETPPPELEVVRTPRSGIGVTHRVVSLLPSRGADGWPSEAPRALAAPRLHAWAGRLLGDPRRVRGTIVHRDADSGEPLASTEVRLADLGLSPLDVLAEQRRGSPATGLEHRLHYLGARNRPEGVPDTAEVDVDLAPADVDRDELRLADVLTVAAAAARVLGGGRAADARDLSRPEAGAAPEIDVDDLARRADQAVGALRQRLADLEDLLATDGADAGALRLGLLALAAFGVPDAVPRSATGETSEARHLLRRQGNAVAGAARHRLDEATRAAEGGSADDAPDVAAERHTARLTAVFGRGFPVVPRFTLPQADTLRQAFADRDARHPAADVIGWFQRVARVRTGVGQLNRLALLTEVLGTAPLDLHVAQLPHVADEPWVGLAPPDGTALPGGRLSLVGQTLGPPQVEEGMAAIVVDEWNEVVPNASETTAVTFNFDEPGAHAPQAVLLAVPPDDRQRWDLATLEATVLDTLELSTLRAVDPDALARVDDVAFFLPVPHLAVNLAGDTVSTDLAGAAGT